MIRFHDTPVNDKAAEQLASSLCDAGYNHAEAEKLSDAAAALAISILRGLDAQIIKAAGTDADEQDCTVMQQLVLMQLIGSMQRAMELNSIQGLFELLFRRKP